MFFNIIERQVVTNNSTLSSSPNPPPKPLNLMSSTSKVEWTSMRRRTWILAGTGQPNTTDCLLQVTKLLKDSKRIDSNNNCSSAHSQKEKGDTKTAHT